MKGKLIVSLKVNKATWTLRGFLLKGAQGQVATRTQGKSVVQLAWLECGVDGEQEYLARVGLDGKWRKAGRYFQGIPVPETFTALEGAAALC